VSSALAFTLSPVYQYPMARRPTKLEFYDHPIVCPYCKANVVFSSLMEWIILPRRNCPVCEREMLIENDRAVRIPGERAKKPLRRIRSRISNAKDGT
jgi:hypothetical protein